MRILQINNSYGYGSTGKLVESNSNILQSKGHSVLNLYGNPPDVIDNNSKRICTRIEHYFNSILSRIDGIPFGGLFLSNRRILREIELFNPDIVHIHCINGQTVNVYKLFSELAKRKIKTVVTLHAEIFHTGGCEHACECNQWKTECKNCAIYKRATASWFLNRANRSWRLMNSAWSKFAYSDLVVTAVSPWLRDRAIVSSMLKSFKVEYVPNGVNSEIFQYREKSNLNIFKNSNPTILFVAPYFTLTADNLKGGFFLPEIANKLPDVNFLIVASTIEKINRQLPLNIKIYGRAESQGKLADIYSHADLTLLLSKRETFSMVTAESLCCGTPVVGFKAGGPESIALPEYTSFTEYGNIVGLISRIEKFLSKKINKSIISQKAIEYYSESRMTSGFIDIYSKLLSS